MLASEDARVDNQNSSSDVELEIPKPFIEQHEDPLENVLDLEDDDFFTRELEAVESINEEEIQSISDDLDISEQLKNLFASEDSIDEVRSPISEVEFEIPEPPAEQREEPLEKSQKLPDDKHSIQETDVDYSKFEKEVQRTPDEDIRERLTKIASEVIGGDDNVPISEHKVEIKRIPTETLGELYVAQKKWDDAIGVYSALLDDYPTSEKYRNRLQAIYKRKLAEESK